MHYRREIDGLRAVAVLPVILFHAGFSVFSGGFVGVDVFFVISGFLITSVLIDELEKDTFSIAQFYERRARRILPALFFVIISCLPFCYLWLSPSQLEDFAKSIISVVLAISNVYFLNQVDYFSPDSETEILLHTWSLAIEEQYYVFFPILLLSIRKLRHKTGLMVVGALVLASLIFSEYGLRKNPENNYLFSLSRFWEIGVGSLCAIWVSGKDQQESNPLSLIGIAMIVFSIFYFDHSTPFPGLYALFPVIGAALILVFANGKTFVGRILSTPAFVRIGLISYSAYLWHQPLFAFARIRSLADPSQTLMAILAAISILLAWATWRWVEQPFRKRKNGILTSRKQVFVTSFAFAAIIMAIGVMGVVGKGFDWRFELATLNMALAADEKLDESCLYRTTNALPVHPVQRCLGGIKGEPIDVMILGDSHSSSIAEALEKSLKIEGISFYNISYIGCVPFVGFQRPDEGSDHLCPKFNADALNFAKKSGIKTLILTARYAWYLRGDRFDNGEGGVEKGNPAWIDLVEYSNSTPDDPERKSRVLAAYEESIRELAKDFNVVLVHPFPEAGWDVPSLAFKNAYFNNSHADISTSYAIYKDRTHEVKALFDRLAKEVPTVHAAPVHVALCKSETNRCINADKKGIYYLDDDHLSSAGAQLVTPIIVKEIKAAMQ